MNIIDADIESQYPVITNGLDDIPIGSKSMQMAPKDPITQDVLSATEKADDSYTKDVLVNNSGEDRTTGAAVANRVGDRMLADSASIYLLHNSRAAAACVDPSLASAAEFQRLERRKA